MEESTNALDTCYRIHTRTSGFLLAIKTCSLPGNQAVNISPCVDWLKISKFSKFNFK